MAKQLGHKLSYLAGLKPFPSNHPPTRNQPLESQLKDVPQKLLAIAYFSYIQTQTFTHSHTH